MLRAIEGSVLPLVMGAALFSHEIPSAEALRGLRYRMPGLGGEVLRRLGA